jgi:hypothetical protein
VRSRIKFKLIAVFIIFNLHFSYAKAETEGFAYMCETGGICLWRRPIVNPPSGWERDQGSSERYKINAFAPKGLSFSDSPVVIYANALYKTPQKVKDLDEFIEVDKEHFTKGKGEIKISPKGSLLTGDKKSLVVLTFEPIGKSKEQFETIAYGEEGEYFLIFALSARSKEAHDKALPAFVEFLHGYTEKSEPKEKREK